jgi:ADP-ribosyl-[dinitrogen reductase] hydrolase
MARLRALPLRHRLFARRRLLSDDTEHACLNAQALARSNGERDSFVRSLAWGLRFWVLSLPAGIGLGTLRALMKLLVGFSPQRSGGGSAGNGPMMRAPVLGLFAADTPDRMRELVGASTRITHQDPRAERAALCVALTTACSAANDQGEPSQLLASLRHEEDAELNEILAAIEVSLGWGEPTSSFAASRGYERGVPGYCYSTLAVVRHAWLSHPSDFEAALTAVVSCGGDTDTTGAILGGIVGAGVGKKGIPAAWLHGLSDWPRSRVWIEALSQQVAYTKLARLARQPVVAPFPFTLIRNLCFMPLVLAHGLRRLFPPY